MLMCDRHTVTASSLCRVATLGSVWGSMHTLTLQFPRWGPCGLCWLRLQPSGQRSSFAAACELACTLCACPCTLSLISLILHPYALAKAGPFTWIAATSDSHSPPTSPPIATCHVFLAKLCPHFSRQLEFQPSPDPTSKHFSFLSFFSFGCPPSEMDSPPFGLP